MKKQIGKFIAVLLPFGVDVLPLLVGQGISKIGDSMLLVALNLTVFQSTHSGTLVGLLDMAIVLPTIVLGPVAGTLVDHGHLKRILLLTSFFQAAMLAILIPYQSNIYVLLVVLFLVSAISSFYMPAFFSLPPRLVTEENALLRLNSTLSITALLASILGASIGGIALFFIGIRGVIIVDLISFVILAVCIFLIKIPQQVADSEISLSLRWKSFYSSVIDGIREIYKHSSLRGLMTIFFIYSLADGFFYPYLVVWATQILQVDNAHYGLLYSALTAGAAFGSVFVIWLGKRVSLLRIIVIMLIALGVFVISLAFNTNYLVAFCFVLFFGLLRASIGLPTTTLVQEKAGDQLIGRVMGAYQSLGELAYVMALAATAIAIKFVGIQVLFVVGGVFYFLSGFVGLIFLHNISTVATDNK